MQAGAKSQLKPAFSTEVKINSVQAFYLKIQVITTTNKR
jgi:hypothetical protein